MSSKSKDKGKAPQSAAITNPQNPQNTPKLMASAISSAKPITCAVVPGEKTTTPPTIQSEKVQNLVDILSKSPELLQALQTLSQESSQENKSSQSEPLIKMIRPNHRVQDQILACFKKVDGGKMKCNFCGKEYAEGTSITRIKCHLSGMKRGGAKACEQAPPDVKAALAAIQLQIDGSRKERVGSSSNEVTNAISTSAQQQGEALYFEDRITVEMELQERGGSHERPSINKAGEPQGDSSQQTDNQLFSPSVNNDVIMSNEQNIVGVRTETSWPGAEEWGEDLKRVSLIENQIKEIPSGCSPRCPSLSTLLLHYNRELELIADTFFEKLHGLKILDLSCTDIVKMPDSVSNLVRLTALLLVGCEKLRHVPSLENLREMRRLDLYRTALEDIPLGLECVSELRYLRMNSRGEKEFPGGILRKLSRLQVSILGRGQQFPMTVKERT